jgi:hypothetical protein
MLQVFDPARFLIGESLPSGNDPSVIPLRRKKLKRRPLAQGLMHGT